MAFARRARVLFNFSPSDSLIASSVNKPSTTCTPLRWSSLSSIRGQDFRHQHQYHHNRNQSDPPDTHCGTWEINSFVSSRGDADFTTTLCYNRVKPLPQIRSPDEVLVRICSTSVNPLDVLMCYGYGNELLEKLDFVTSTRCRAPGVSFDRLPLTLGRDFSGIIVDKGCNVKNVNINDTVMGAIPPYKQGCHSHYVIAKDSEIIRKPQNISHNEAACFPYAGLTALSTITTFGGLNETNCAGKRILVLGGTGGVGSIVVQILQNWNAWVATTCSADAISWLQELIDVDQVIDYRSDGLSQYIQSFDMVIDCAKRTDGTSIDHQAYKCLKKRCSQYITINSPLLRNFDEKGLIQGALWNILKASQDGFGTLRDGIVLRWAFYHPSYSGLKLLSQLVQKGAVKPIIDQVFPMDQLPDAYTKVRNGHLRGKTIIQIQS